MATAAQLTANRANAQSSTGPRTHSGKSASSRNAITHGLSSKDIIVLPGQEAHFQEFLTGLQNELNPDGPIEQDLFLQLLHTAWTLRRCRAAEASVQLDSLNADIDILAQSGAELRLRNIDLYARRAERSYYRALNELRRIQSERLYRRSILLAAADGPAAAPEPTNSPLVETRAMQSDLITYYRLTSEARIEQMAELDISDLTATRAAFYAGHQFGQSNPTPNAVPSHS
jgi:hypothetical protein